MTNSILSGTPESWTRLPVQTLFSLSKPELDSLQLHWAQTRFQQLQERIPALDALAEKQGVKIIADFETLATILFTHHVYKNYPFAFIERKLFTELTRWLNKLTAHDLSSLDMRGVNTIDEWLTRLDEAGMFVFHSTGTSGKLSFFPRSQTEKEVWVEGTYTFLEAFMPGIRNLRLPVFWPAYRSGRQASMRLITHFGPALAGSEAEYHSLFNAPMSADFMSLAMRMKHAQEHGDLTAMDTIKAIFKTKGEIVTLKARKAGLTKSFFDKMVREYRGRRVFLMASATDLLDVAVEGLAAGQERVFASDSVLLTGGGFKGRQTISDWKDILKKFYGVDQVFMSYGMTELNTYNIACSKGVYHVFPWNIPMVLGNDGTPLPRTGVQTGRAGYFDLLAQTYWGGILTGDCITVHYDEECDCGWKGPWIEDNVQRFSELMGGEDIISCAGVQSAYSDFMEYIAADVPEGE
ncbi:MAG TPA: hypothetical protein PK152_04905 [Anaerolineales bacterium]|nr:hypothetical protein [Anaerolineae bacterium]HRJ57631.1 hypothetical protein [Anaerolineales bacterium]HRK88450.1 hypothetical protein [Anaerolineales bacterium]